MGLGEVDEGGYMTREMEGKRREEGELGRDLGDNCVGSEMCEE